MRIMIGWELGGNYGHVLKLFPIMKALRQRGHQVFLAVSDMAVAETLLGKTEYPLIEAPMPLRKNRLNRDIASHADILAAHGFAEYEALSLLAGAWQHLYQQRRPDAVVVNHAPAALFAARLADMPVIEIGTGFEIPPRLSPYPCFRPWLNLPDSTFLEAEQSILVTLNRLRRLHRKEPHEFLCDAVRSDHRVLATFSETDHYPVREKSDYAGPLFVEDDGMAVEWPDVHEKNILVYMRPTDQLIQMLDRLEQIKANVICAIPGVDPRIQARYGSPALHIHDSHVRLGPLLGRCNLAVSFAGHGLISACLLAGVPMLLVPTHIEQLLLSSRVTQAGMGLALSLVDVALHFTALLKRVLNEPDFTLQAKKLASRHSTYAPHTVVEHTAGMIERAAGGNS